MRQGMVKGALPTAPHEWRSHWLLVLSGMIGVTVGIIPSATLGLFMAPLQTEFGWNRTEISAGLAIFAMVSLPLGPFGGVLVDKFGARRIAIPGVALSMAVFASFSLLGGSLFQWFATWVLYTVASLMVRTLVWNSAISRAFVAGRGLAIAVLLCGVALAQSLSPVIARWLIDSHGWRMGYLGLGLGWGGLAFLVSACFFRDRGAVTKAAENGLLTPAQHQPGGLTLKQAIRSLTMSRIAIANFVLIITVSAIMVHLVPMLTANGLTRSQAAGFAALLGAASAVGKLTTGWLVDRVGGSLVPVITYGLPAPACLILVQSAGSLWLISAGVLLLGYTGGGTLQLSTYLTTRYAGLHKFGTIYGIISTLMGVASGVGPLLAGAIFDITGSYTLLLAIGILTGLIASVAVFGLGRYPEFAPQEA